MKISVITTTYNSGSTIAETLSSIATQTHREIEHIVIDGASTDNTVALIRAHSHGVAKLISEPDKGIYDALNKGIANASGNVVGFLHADDLYAHPSVLADIAEAFADTGVCAVYGALPYVKQSDTSAVVRHWQSSPYSARRLAWGWMPPHPTLYVRRERYERIGGFDTRYRIAADYFRILQLFSLPGFKAVYLPQVLVKMRLGGASNRSLGNIVRKSGEDFDALRRSRVGALGGVGALVSKNLSKIGQFF